jgi:serine/threonine-protein kinase
MNPTAEENYRILGVILGQLGPWAEAERVIREGMTLPETGTYTLASLGYVLARSGQRAPAEALLEELTRRLRGEYISPVAFATIHLGLGNAGPALDWTELAHAERRGWLAYLRLNPIFDPIRAEPRFQALLARMGW